MKYWLTLCGNESRLFFHFFSDVIFQIYIVWTNQYFIIVDTIETFIVKNVKYKPLIKGKPCKIVSHFRIACFIISLLINMKYKILSYFRFKWTDRWKCFNMKCELLINCHKWFILILYYINKQNLHRWWW